MLLNPVPPKRSLRCHLKVIPPHNDINGGLPTEIRPIQLEYVDICLSSKQKDNLLHEMHEDGESLSSVEDGNNKH